MRCLWVVFCFLWIFDHIAIDGDEGHLGPQLIGDVDLVKADPFAVLHLMGLCCEVFAAGGFQEGDLRGLGDHSRPR